MSIKKKIKKSNFLGNNQYSKLSIKERFFQKVQKTDYCWNWIAYKNRGGYGIFSINKKSMHASRVSYELFVGKIPTNLLVCHYCDNPLCVNPKHLFLGTNHDNIMDSVYKKRHKNPILNGELNGMSKLTEESVRLIRNLYKEKGDMAILYCAKKFNISDRHIKRVIMKKSWKHIND